MKGSSTLSRCNKIHCASLLFILLLISALVGCGAQQRSNIGQENGDPSGAATVKLRAGQPIDSLVLMPVYVARFQNFFADEGLSVQWVTLGGGISPTQALSTGDFDFIAEGAGTVFAAIDKGQPLRMVQNIQQGATATIMASNRFAEETGLSIEQPFEQKLESIKQYALKHPIKWGVTRPNAPSDLDARRLIKQMGLTPDKEIEVVSLGSVSSITTAITGGDIQLAPFYPPTNFALQKERQAVPLIVQSKEIPDDGMRLNEVLAVRSDLIEQKPELVRKIVRAMNRANRFIAESPVEELTDMMKYFFPDVDTDVLQEAVGYMKGLVPPDGRFKEESVRISVVALIESRAVKPGGDPEMFYTNEFLD